MPAVGHGHILDAILVSFLPGSVLHGVLGGSAWRSQADVPQGDNPEGQRSCQCQKFAHHINAPNPAVPTSLVRAMSRGAMSKMDSPGTYGRTGLRTRFAILG